MNKPLTRRFATPKKEKILSVQQHPFLKIHGSSKEKMFSHVGRLHRSAVIQAPSWEMWSHISGSSRS